MLSIKDGRERREYWQHAAALLIDDSKGAALRRLPINWSWR